MCFPTASANFKQGKPPSSTYAHEYLYIRTHSKYQTKTIKTLQCILTQTLAIQSKLSCPVQHISQCLMLYRSKISTGTYKENSKSVKDIDSQKRQPTITGMCQTLCKNATFKSSSTLKHQHTRLESPKTNNNRLIEWYVNVMQDTANMNKNLLQQNEQHFSHLSSSSNHTAQPVQNTTLPETDMEMIDTSSGKRQSSQEISQPKKKPTSNAGNNPHDVWLGFQYMELHVLKP